MRRLTITWVIILFFAATGVKGLGLKLSDKGVGIDAGDMGGFSLPNPILKVSGKEQKPIESRHKAGKTVLKYASGAVITVWLENGVVHYDFSGNTAGVQSFAFKSFMIPFKFADGGSWKIGDGKEKSFPSKKPTKPFLFQGNASSFALKSVHGKVINIQIPEYSYQQLQDNREWGWKIFCLWFSVPFNKDNPHYKVTISENAKNVKKITLVDRFGQSTRKEFPGKIKSEAELKADVETEMDYYNSLKRIDTDKLGGMVGSGEKLGLKKTGFFHVEKKNERWYLVDPDGNAFFHLGICVFSGCDDFTYTEGRESDYEWIPPKDGVMSDARRKDSDYWFPRAVSFYRANVIRKYGEYNEKAHLMRMIDRVKGMGFNSVGAFSGGHEVYKAEGFPYVSSLPFGWGFAPDIPGVRGMFDPFDPKVAEKMDEKFKGLAKGADNPLIIGFFLANEQGIEDIPRAVPKLPAKHHCKQALVKELEKKYKTIDAFNKAWNMKAASFAELNDKGLPVTTKVAFADMENFMEVLLEKYYSLIADTFHKYDKNHMLIGNRWQPGTANNEILCRVAGKYMDVISINYYADGIDHNLMNRLYKWTGGRPQMWSEFYFTSEKESNVQGGGHDFDSQADRGRAYRHYIENAAATGYVVGTEWFTLIDQSVTGRFFSKYNGERNNTGIFDVADRPYKDMVAQMAVGHKKIYDVWVNGETPYQFNHPRFSGSGNVTRTVAAGHALGEMAIDGQLTNWPGRPPVRIESSRLVSGNEKTTLEASYKACWDEKNLYFLVNVMDKTPMMNNKTSSMLWSADCIELFIGVENVDRPGALLFTDRQLLFGMGKANGSQVYVPNVPKQPKVKMVVARDGANGYTAEIAIPWSDLGVKPKEGTVLLFDMGIDNSDDGERRNAQIMWNGGARNSSDRGLWGRLKLER